MSWMANVLFFLKVKKLIKQVGNSIILLLSIEKSYKDDFAFRLFFCNLINLKLPLKSAFLSLVMVSFVAETIVSMLRVISLKKMFVIRLSPFRIHDILLFFGINLSKMATLPPSFKTLSVSKMQATGFGITAKIRCRITMSNCSSANSKSCPSITKASIWLLCVVLSFLMRSTIDGVISVAVMEQLFGKNSKSKPVPAPMISILELALICNPSIDFLRDTLKWRATEL